MTLLRLIVRLVNALAVVAVLMIAVVVWFVRSESGAARAVAYFAARMPGGMEIGRVEGTLAGGLLLSGVALRAGRGRLTIEQLAVWWSASSLLARAAIAERAEMRNVVYRTAPGDTDGSGGSAGNAAAPVPLVVRSAAIDTLTLHTGEQPLVFDRVELSGRWVASRLVVDDVRTESGSVALTGSADILFEDRVRLSAGINWAGGSGGERAAGYLQVRGVLPTLVLRHQLALPIEAVAGGEAEIRRRNGETMLEAGALSVETDGEALRAVGRLSLATTEWQLALEDAGDGASGGFRGRSSEGESRLEGRLLPWSLPGSGRSGTSVPDAARR